MQHLVWCAMAGAFVSGVLVGVVLRNLTIKQQVQRQQQRANFYRQKLLTICNWVADWLNDSAEIVDQFSSTDELLEGVRDEAGKAWYGRDS